MIATLATTTRNIIRDTGKAILVDISENEYTYRTVWMPKSVITIAGNYPNAYGGIIDIDMPLWFAQKLKFESDEGCGWRLF